MKDFLIILFVLICQQSEAQTLKLIPDSCTYCTYKRTDGQTHFNENYHIDPSKDTLIIGNVYKQIFYSHQFNWAVQTIGVRQIGNKVFGIPFESDEEFLIMDFDAAVGDTIYGLYSEGYFYDAIVSLKDSTLLSDDSYQHWMELIGDTIYGFNEGTWLFPWTFRWNERGICNVEFAEFNTPYGGYAFNVPINSLILSYQYAFINYCTSDPLIIHSPPGVTCNQCIFWTNDLEELDFNSKEIVRIVDVMGVDCVEKSNGLMIYIYSDGSTKKVFKIE